MAWELLEDKLPKRGRGQNAKFKTLELIAGQWEPLTVFQEEKDKVFFSSNGA